MPTKTAQPETRGVIIASAQSLMARKGYSAVGLNEILATATVPKGSFYYYFASKDALGEALLQSYFTDYLADMDRIFGQEGRPASERLLDYWDSWMDSQSSFDCQGKCLVVKLGAEVADLSESMRTALHDGTQSIVDRLESAIRSGIADGSVRTRVDARVTAGALYSLWLGASVTAKIDRTTESLTDALTLTRQILGLTD